MIGPLVSLDGAFVGNSAPVGAGIKTYDAGEGVAAIGNPPSFRGAGRCLTVPFRYGVHARRVIAVC